MFSAPPSLRLKLLFPSLMWQDRTPEAALRCLACIHQLMAQGSAQDGFSLAEEDDAHKEDEEEEASRDCKGAVDLGLLKS